jgi:hypothetical protein
VQSQKDEMTLLQNKLRQQKAQLQRQNVVVDVLSKQVVSVSSYSCVFHFADDHHIIHAII